MTDVFYVILILAAATAAASVTIAWTRIFAWPRDWIVAHCWDWLGHLVTCHYCIGHWVAAALVAVSMPWHGVISYVVSWLAVTGVAGIFSSLILKE